ncbi:MAG TPA: hypothetical protein VN972_06700, partial [Methylomirabilota bacterium]|nr:hypothetical protein [Methylomirabilota bacterium]
MLLTCQAAGAHAAPAPAPHASPAWVFFRDHGALAVKGPARDEALAEAARKITPRALARRAKAAGAAG